MRKIVPFILMLTILLAIATVSQAQETPDALMQEIDSAFSSAAAFLDRGTLEVRGQAIRAVAPDTAVLRVGATITDKDQKVALQQANEITGAVLEAIKQFGVEESQIMTSAYGVSRVYDYSYSTKQDKGFEARVQLKITLNDFDLINNVLDVAVEAGANDISDIQFSYSKENEVYRQALVDAITVAREKAEDMAKALGVEIASLEQAREDSWGGAYYNSYTAKSDMGVSMEAAGGAQVMSGEIEITANVTLTYKVK